MTTVRARIEALARGEYTVRCGECGHFLDVAYATWTEAPPTNDNLQVHFWGGWRRDDEGVWRPTTDHKRLRQEARQKVRRATPEEREELRRKLKYNDFHRPLWNRDDRWDGHSFMVTDENRDAHQLPQQAECPKCEAENLIAAD